MLDSRRHLLCSLISFASAASLPAVLFAAQHPAPPYKASPNAPDPHFPQGMNGPGPTRPDQKTIDRQNQEQIRTEVDKMFAIVSELKQQLSVTNTSAVLSVDFVKKAHEIEKLAKHVKELAKG